MRPSRLEFGLLSEGRLETWDALFEFEQIAEASASRCGSDPDARDSKTANASVGVRLRRIIVGLLNAAARRRGKSRKSWTKKTRGT